MDAKNASRVCFAFLLMATVFIVLGSIRFGRRAAIQPNQDRREPYAGKTKDSTFARQRFNLRQSFAYNTLEKKAAHVLSSSNDTTVQAKTTTTTNTTTTTTSKTRLVIVTYTRSGSTFTGDVFNHHPHVFYFYEPLRSLDFHFLRDQPAFFFGQKPLMYNATDPDQLTSLQNDVIRSTLNCQFLAMYIQPLMLDWSHNKSLSCRPFADCTDAQPGMLGLMSCLPLLREACVTAQVTVVKTTRFSLKQAATLLEDDPKVKVIHLVRDPRGILRSRTLAGMVGSPLITHAGDIQELCSKMAENFRDSELLKKQFPGRILTARYEDLSEQPLEFSSRLLSFAGLAMTPQLRQYIWRITSTHDEFDDVMWQTRRSDSRRTATQWRRDLDIGSVAVVDALCAELYRYAGYLPLRSKNVQKNMAVATHKKWKQVPALWTTQ